MNKIKICFGILFALLITGCQKDNTLNIGEKHDFKIVSYLQEDGNIMPLSETKSVTTNMAIDGYKMIGVLTPTFDYDPNSTGFDLSRKIFWDTQTDINGKYEGETRNWVTDGTTRHTFYAYSSNPTGTPAGNGVKSIGGMATDHTQPYITFEQLDDPTKQVDLLTTNGVINIKTDNNVPLLNFYFRHRLARISLNLYCAGGASLVNCQAQITYGTNKVKKSAGIVLAPGQYINFSGAIYHSGTFNLGASFTLPSSANTIDNSLLVGDLILIPQVVKLGYITLDIKYKLSASDATFRRAIIDLDPISLQGERQYTYFLNLHEISTNLTITGINIHPWTTQSAVIDELK